MAGPSIIPLLPAASGHATDGLVGAIAAAVVLLAVLAYAARLLVVRHQVRAAWLIVPAVALAIAAAVGIPFLVAGGGSTPGVAETAQRTAVGANPYLDPGTPLSRPAPDFTLTNQFGRRVSLRSFRGRVVMLAFTDSECTTMCPLMTSAMVDAKAMLGPAASRVKLLGVDANPAATARRYVASYSQLHGMMRAWDFLTGPVAQLKRVWHDYGILAQVVHDQIDHTPALFLIGPDGREARVYITQQSYSAVSQSAQILAEEASRLLPGHPPVNSHLTYRPVPQITPRTVAHLPRAGGGSVRLGPGSPHLYAFFATWDREVTDLAGDLQTLNRYAAMPGVPPVTAVDEGRLEPSPRALPDFLRRLRRPLCYPVAVDRTGRVGDGYEVLDEPWLVLIGADGRILWFEDASVTGWPTPAALAAHVRAALARAPSAPTTAAAVAQALAGSPPPLAALHAQAGRVLGGEPALAARLKALRGYPVVLNAWASWCVPCQSEFPRFASASARYGRRVAFLGADTNDPGDAQAFLEAHPVSYPSYTTSSADLGWLAAVGDLPTTVFIARSGKVAYVHLGPYETQGSLDGDIARYAR